MRLTIQSFSTLMVFAAALRAAVAPARAADGVTTDQPTFAPGKQTKTIDAQMNF